MIFEEAAGISRFKLKKIEALRRLERVEQNLLRLSDIVDEVDSRLRSVRLQAGKARRYKEYTDRLQELRTQVGLVDWRRLTERLAELRGRDCSRWPRSATPRPAAAEALEARLLEADAEIGRDQRGHPPGRGADRRQPRADRRRRNRPSSTSGPAAATWSRRSPATAANWSP